MSRVTGTKSYRWRVWGFTTLAVLYVIIALSPAKVSDDELFPFFNWSLFTHNTPVQRDTVAIFKSVNGEQFPQPKLFYDLKETFAHAESGNPLMLKALYRLGNAVEVGDREKALKIENLIEGYYLKEANAASYDVAVIEYEPIKRLKDDEYEIVTLIGSYRKGE